ncbi:MAG: bifunctional histidinol-phosphatase/imidazoleglycerol-phosphate dehydratase HisB [Stenotrophomonas rhizophila]|jgi:imidazoleglycerol-phosphate dehydratase/histidinol-phosphatase|uniref:bifunctional histidinol-phosphatase/imidazoleglycerol-phosphate dehydratase HisB n=1 Tax=Stenotrophomonas TaxID=40323 RepID=UPI0010C03D9E|nr:MULTISPECIES: bifunctional histidinol-phosphatase/imidazoleglycerol-phosphate dehydratase HisB [Stenotrophomonas]MDY0953068.1 bifunctional histidinol-phosphatase/imidazoleglycerol-phosphate dehydratase HisB [Stenotrophomonas rhizophila]QHB71233.1 bifunctional histidinol-phosphatase/imidazoleglycerol-phosphate dehydratase HisB [Stenotrophomonas sp. 364]TKK09416.1 bifunctional histidinol-phosphatase/imidazoleglycerol-phosphate dehydratase [Stenotrophomonas rhizophila]
MTPILFVDRDGTLIEEPADFQIDAYEKIRFVRDVIPAMLKLRDAGYQFVIVSNQDGLGSEGYPQASFDGPNDLMLQIFASQGIVFRDVLIDGTWPHDNAPTRKPGIGMMLPYLQDRSIDWARSGMVGDRPTDIQFAENMKIRGFQLRTEQFGGQWDWNGIAHELADAPRRATVQRNTKETRIRVEVDLDRTAEPQTHTGLPFFDHMLEQIGKHGGFALSVQAEGDLHIDEHHTIEDTGLALGQALREALGDKRGIGRYGFTLPMDETLASAALDFSGRPYFVFEGEFKRERVGDMPTELVPHFFRSLCDAAGLNLHLSVRGDNDHHKVEACFKALARALRQALPRQGTALPSTKGAL